MTERKVTPIYRGWTVPERYESKPSDLDACPECGGPKTKHGAMCIACRRRIGRAVRPAVVRFWEKVDIRGDDECWPWLGVLRGTGKMAYGVFHGPERVASRAAWTFTWGAIDAGMGVLHRCDNPPCCNPNHLFLGTQADNMRDMAAKGRGRWRKRAAA